MAIFKGIHKALVGIINSIAVILLTISSLCFEIATAWSRSLEDEIANRDVVFSRMLEDSKELSVGDIFAYISIPFVSGIVGFGTNWLALKMTFYPLNFWGIKLLGKYSRCEGSPLGCLGWQGIVPTKAGKMASTNARTLQTLFNMKDLFSRIDRTQASIHMKEGFESALGNIIDEVSDKFIISNATKWKRTEDAIKKQIIAWTLNEVPSFTHNFMEELIENLDDVYDLEDMCVKEMVENKQLLNDVFENVGAKEMIFIRNSGFYFGFLFGIIQLIVWIFLPYGIVLPIFGFFVGYLTNFIALKMIFSPIEPWTLNFGFTKYELQGLFLKRQQEASISFAQQMVSSVLHSQKIWTHMLNGPKREEFILLLDKHVDGLTDSIVGRTRPLVIGYLGEDNFGKMKDMIRDNSREQIEEIIEFMHEYTDEALDLENEIATKMSQLPTKEFERVLHPVFEEDEFKLILVGAMLGVLVGFFQQYVVFQEPAW